ncbi:MAG: ATP-binding protein, partial [Mycobacterium sp.]
MDCREPPASGPRAVCAVARFHGSSLRLMGPTMILRHNGVLFLDELCEFSRQHLEALRQPLEERSVTVARARSAVTYPADFM